MIDYTTAKMVADVKRRAALPPVQPRFSDSNIVSFCDEEMRNVLVPLIMSTAEEHFVTYTELELTPTSFIFATPRKAIGNKITSVTRVVPGQSQDMEIPQASPNDGARGYPFGYILRGNKIIVSSPGQGFTMRVYYYRRPNMLVDVSKAAKILAINTGTGVVSCATVPTAWVTGAVHDAIDTQPTFEVLFEGVANAMRAGNDITLPLASAALLSVGGYLTLEGESVVPTQIPVEGHSLIVEAAIAKVAQSLGDVTLLRNSQENYANLKGGFLQAISPRADRAPRKAVSRGGSCWDYM